MASGQKHRRLATQMSVTSSFGLISLVIWICLIHPNVNVSFVKVIEIHMRFNYAASPR